ncbi:MAG: aminopeptidase P family protein [Prevotellaceae bacterium]|jgi:Xaa-Pro aminopeptidase|nr:aminopeptidase P family protein [Prevotellaceae bacterium]
MNSAINQRIDALRHLMAKEGVAAFIVPSTDPHLSEYIAPHWMSRQWISGFTGSAGTVVVTATQAGLWTDSRYFLQAGEQLSGTGITLYKEMLPDTPSIPAFLSGVLQAGDTVGIDGKMFCVEEVEKLQAACKEYGIQVKPMPDPFEVIWHHRPCMPLSPAFRYQVSYAGMDVPRKLAAVRNALREQQAQALLLPALDEIAWTLNLRGSDVHCNPVVVSYLLIEEEAVHYFISGQKLTPEVMDYLHEIGVTLHDYDQIEAYLHSLPATSLWLHPAKTNYAVYSAIRPECRIIRAASPVTLLKAIRNPVEIAGLHAAMQRDGVALVKFLKWLEEAVPQGGQTELSVTRKLHELRAAQPLYRGESFDTIAGYKAHGAIVHYEATQESDVPLAPEGFLLLDSGAQYLDGTTDITRTIALGALTQEEQLDYTLVLKGHIALAMAVFPAGTRGAQVDILARLPLWNHRMNFLHGTGHGVGHFLNVHEGPQSIRMNENPIVLQAGMLTSNEPGVYKAGSHGIRTENLLLTVPAGEGMFGSYLRFETVTLCPIDTRPILKGMLTFEEIAWLNNYHCMVREKLSPLLDTAERDWLEQQTKSI